eukprot:5125249-Pleurochrysis_carterae.AAC.1
MDNYEIKKLVEKRGGRDMGSSKEDGVRYVHDMSTTCPRHLHDMPRVLQREQRIEVRKSLRDKVWGGRSVREKNEKNVLKAELKKRSAEKWEGSKEERPASVLWETEREGQGTSVLLLVAHLRRR